MALRAPNVALRPARDHRIAVELALVVVVLAGFALWRAAVATAATPLLDVVPFVRGLRVEALLTGGLFLGGLVLFAGGYAARRDIGVGLTLPSVDDRRLVVAALVLPAALLGVTKLVGTLTGVPFNALAMRSVAADAPMVPVVVVTGLGVLVGVPATVATCQVVVQGSLRRAVDGDAAVVLTTLVTAFLLTSGRGGPSPVPDRGKLAGAALLVVALALALVAADRVSRPWLRFLAALPVVLLVALVALSSIAAVETVAGALFAATHVLVFGLAAYGYERTGSLLVPALAYLSASLASPAIVLLFEAGMRSW